MTQSCPSKLTVFSLCSPPLLLYLLYAPSRGYADQCPLNLSSASVCAKIIGDSPPAASGANIRSLLLQGGGSFVVSTAPAGRLLRDDPLSRKGNLRAFVICANLYAAHSIPMSVVQPLLVWLPRLSACMSKEALWRMWQQFKENRGCITAAREFYLTQTGLVTEMIHLRGSFSQFFVAINIIQLICRNLKWDTGTGFPAMVPIVHN